MHGIAKARFTAVGPDAVTGTIEKPITGAKTGNVLEILRNHRIELLLENGETIILDPKDKRISPPRMRVLLTIAFGNHCS